VGGSVSCFNSSLKLSCLFSLFLSLLSSLISELLSTWFFSCDLFSAMTSSCCLLTDCLDISDLGICPRSIDFVLCEGELGNVLLLSLFSSFTSFGTSDLFVCSLNFIGFFSSLWFLFLSPALILAFFLVFL